MNKKYLIIGAILLVGGYIAYKKFFTEKEEETTDNETPVNRGVVAPTYTPAPAVVSESAPTLVVPSATTSLTKTAGSQMLSPKDNIATQSAPSSNFSYAGLGKY
jgi:hypothetical protein